MQRRSRILFPLGIVACLLFAASIQAEISSDKLKPPEPGMVQRLTLNDGSTLIGKITAVGDEDVTFQSSMGEMTIKKENIKSIEEMPESSYKGGKYWYPNPNQTRLLIGPTARTLPPGKGYLFDIMIFFPGAAIGVTKNFMISGGGSIFPGVDDQLLYFIPKIGVGINEQLDVAASVVVLYLLDEAAFLGMGTMTFGEPDYSLTAGLALAWTDEELQDEPAWTIGGEYRFARRLSLVAEGWYIPGTDGAKMFMPAIRFFGEQMTLDFGMGFGSGNDDDDPYDSDDDASWIPYLDFVWNF